MTNQELTALLKYPQHISADSVPHLKELVEQYPYFTPARLLHLRGLQQSDDIHFEKALKEASLYCRSRQKLYYFVYPEKKADEQQAYTRPGNKSGDYFDMLDSVEKNDGGVNKSLKKLAERLKNARINILAEKPAAVSKEEHPAVSTVSPMIEPSAADAALTKNTEDDYTDEVRRLIRQKRYEEALKILKGLNLNNPKKSIYFADQIRFLEKVIDNIKK